jgi:Uma2 family endonuclease
LSSIKNQTPQILVILWGFCLYHGTYAASPNLSRAFDFFKITRILVKNIKTMNLVAEKIYTVEEYFELERNSEVKHEFVEGQLIEMPGEKRIANKLSSRLLVKLLGLLNENVYDVYIQDVKLSTVKGKRYRYPDVMVVPVVDDEDEYTVHQAVLVAEILSPSTEKTDRNDKLKEYSKIPSVQYYLLVSQEETVVELYRRNGNIFEYSFYTEKTDVIDFPFFDIKLTLDDVYKNIL